MENNSNLQEQAAFIRTYISFSGTEETDPPSDQSKLQSEGTAALWHRIQSKQFAYLADEVGMGKTRQAMAIIVTQLLIKPNSRIVIICPGKPLQEQWASEWNKFISDCFLWDDGTLKSPLDKRTKIKLSLHDRLSQFAQALLLDEDKIHLLRYSAFSRPIGFGKTNKKTNDTPSNIENDYRNHLQQIGISELNEQEKKIIEESNTSDIDWRSDLTKALNSEYATRFSTLVRDESRPIDLIVCDEAQYLRHTGNARNSNINASIGQQQQTKWLFMSATPLHNGPHDIKCLDTYLCTHTMLKQQGKEQNKQYCQHQDCAHIARRLEGKNVDKKDVMEILSDFLVRRPRKYNDNTNKQYNKVEYRQYQENAVVATDDAFASLVTSLVQKKLVSALAGKNNKFRQGECSSFESLASSVGKKFYTDSDGNKRQIKEIEDTGSRDNEETPDRHAIDKLNESLRSALSEAQVIKNIDPKQITLPHAKLYEVAAQLNENCIKNAPNHKALVFVRRLATVEEIMVLVQQLYQQEIDRRINLWQQFLNATNSNQGAKQNTNKLDSFWTLKDNEENIKADEDEKTEGNSAMNRAEHLPFFKAILEKKDNEDTYGLLQSFSSRLLQNTKDNKSLLPMFVPNAESSNKEQEQSQWDELLLTLYPNSDALEKSGVDSLSPEKTLILKKALLQSMRRSDFLVDLYIMKEFFETPNDGKPFDLTDKLIYLFELAKNQQFSDNFSDLNTYFNNWRERLRNWCDHFTLIYEKCFLDDGKANDAQILKSMTAKFAKVGPVIGRSGSIQNVHAVTQFKMPCYPNILICTDVLKEGVDMHLFCDEVIHYGVAWTSGDLEQRIGRVDRVKSQINRRIANYNGDSKLNAPKLNVQFPYLAGTLDQHQVSRVVKDKRISDLRMDFGKNSEEVKELSINNIQFSSTIENAGSVGDKTLKTKTFLPSTINSNQYNLSNNSFVFLQNDNKKHYAKLKENLDAIQVKHNKFFANIFDELKTLAITYDINDDSALMSELFVINTRIKWCTTPVKRSFHYVPHYQALVPTSLNKEELEQTITAICSETGNVSPCSIRQANYATGFQFDKQWNTLKKELSHEAPYKQSNDRKQIVILESMGNSIIARSPILTSTVANQNINNLEEWIARKNNNLNFAYLLEADGILWLCITIINPEKFENSFNDIIEKLSQTADRLQLRYSGKDEENWDYKSQSTLQTLVTKGFMPSDIQQEVLNNEIFADQLAEWLKKQSTPVMAILCNNAHEDDFDYIQSKTKMKIKSTGVIQSTMKKANWLRHQAKAYLELLPDKKSNHLTYNEPRIVWQVQFSNSTKGNNPELTFFNWKNLPHRNGEEWLFSEKTDKFSFHTYREKADFSIVLYHPWNSLEGKLREFANVWSQMISLLREDENNGKECFEILHRFFS